MERRDDEEYESQDALNDITDNREYIDSLRASSNDPEDSQTGIDKSLGPEVQTYRLFLNVRVLKDTFEVKTTLRSPAEFDGLKKLITDYFECGHQFQGAQIEILTSPNPGLIEELKRFRSSCKEKYVIPFGIRLVYQGKVV